MRMRYAQCTAAQESHDEEEDTCCSVQHAYAQESDDEEEDAYAQESDDDEDRETERGREQVC